MKSETRTLLEEVSSYENLFQAFKECSRGKKSRAGYQKFIFNFAENLKEIELEMMSRHKFKWGGYREFYVHDPKKRLVMAAPFRDRIVHTAIHRVIFPLIDKKLGSRTFACRYGMGNRNAVLKLRNQLRIMKKNRYCIKLDVKKYFESISHQRLFEKFVAELPDASLNELIKELISSHPLYKEKGRGIPIGNLTSQLFANYYLSSVDREACEKLGINFFVDQVDPLSFYIRYMDDMVILSDSKERATDVALHLVDYAKKELSLDIPSEKIVFLSKDPVPFLGFVLTEDDDRPLRRNERKFLKKLKRASQMGMPSSHKAQMILSYESWQKI